MNTNEFPCAFYGYEVQKNGVTLEWDVDIKHAEHAFKAAMSGNVVMYKHFGQTKTVVNSK